MRKFRVVSDWMASYPDPVEVKAGDRLTLSGAQEIWDGYRWLWALTKFSALEAGKLVHT